MLPVKTKADRQLESYAAMIEQRKRQAQKVEQATCDRNDLLARIESLDADSPDDPLPTIREALLYLMGRS